MQALRRSAAPSRIGSTYDRYDAGPSAPFLKWPGGKRWAGPSIGPLIRNRLRGIYFEPFLGGGAMYFYVRPDRAILADINRDLINVYRAVRDHFDELLDNLIRLPVSKKMYYQIRKSEPSNSMLRAVRFLYLNRTAFAGMYRLNQSGEFNVPYGGGQRGTEILWRTAMLKQASSALQNAKLLHGDFETTIEQAGRGDVVYCDPTYTVTHDNNGFVRYNERNFSWADQERLVKAARRAKRRGATVIVSNAHHREIRKIYGSAEFLTLTRPSTLSVDPSNRRTIQEYLILL